MIEYRISMMKYSYNILKDILDQLYYSGVTFPVFLFFDTRRQCKN